MSRAICGLWFLLAVTSLASGSEPPWKGQIRHPRIIRNVELKGLTASIPSTKLFIPKRDGFYRIFVYMVMTKTVNCQCYWDLALIGLTMPESNNGSLTWERRGLGHSFGLKQLRQQDMTKLIYTALRFELTRALR